MPMTSPGNKHPTIDDVARKAAVSTATAPRVLNRPQTVSASLRSKVAAAVTRPGYVSLAGARALMRQRSGTVGAVFPTVDIAIFATAIDALGRRLAQSDIPLLIATSGYQLLCTIPQALTPLT